MPSLIGNKPNQVPTNGDLGDLAFRNHVGIIANPGAAPTIASATTIQPTTPVVFVSGTTTIDTIIPPPQMVGGGQIILIPTGLWSTGTAGNIAIATTGVVSRALLLIYDAATVKWYPSY
jgi:hypothetical protein